MGRDADWVREFWPALESLCREHMDGHLDDTRMRAALSAVARGLPIPPTAARNPAAPTDPELIAKWRKNDALGADLHANPAAYMCGPALAKVFAGFRQRREAENPALAASYYASRSTSP